MYRNIILNELSEALKTLNKFIYSERNIQAIEDAAKLIATTFTEGRKVISCGNGGSHCDAMHFASELTGRYRKHRSAYPAIAISDPSYISCVGNDFSYEKVFSRYIEAVGNEGDILLSISTSGQSVNILRAIDTAKNKNMKVIFLTGKKNLNIYENVDIEIYVPYISGGYSDRIQEIHIKIIHILVLLIEKQMSRMNH